MKESETPQAEKFQDEPRSRVSDTALEPFEQRLAKAASKLAFLIRGSANLTVILPPDIYQALVEMEDALSACSICGKPWHEHYKPDFLKFKMGPYGTFGLEADHTPHIPGLHASRRDDSDS